jgi:hypothetical protein
VHIVREPVADDGDVDDGRLHRRPSGRDRSVGAPGRVSLAGLVTLCVFNPAVGAVSGGLLVETLIRLRPVVRLERELP